MARFDGKVEVTLSATDRQLLRDIRDALRALGDEPEGEGSASDAVQRLMESGLRGPTPVYCGNGPSSDEWDYRFLDDHIDADTKGYAWNGSGWVPKG